MRHSEIKNQLKKEIEIPNVLDEILLQCKDKEISVKEKKKSIWMIPSFAMAVFLLIIGIFFYQGYSSNTIIEFDVNPSIQLEVNSKNQITKAVALNEDGRKILNDMNLVHSDLTVGVNAIIGSMLKEGYLSELKNSILVSVDSKDKRKGESLQKSLSEEIDTILNTYSIVSSVITQDYEITSSLENQAKSLGVSEGKMVFIHKILESGLTSKNGNSYTVETLSELNIQELKAILDSKNQEVKNTTSTGKASTMAYIGSVKAKQVSLDHAKVEERLIYDLEIELDYEMGKMIYEVSFDYNQKEYEYDIDAKTGEILHFEIEDDDIKEKQKSIDSKSYIGSNKAISIALENAGTSSHSVKDLESELDYEYGKAIYEVSFDYKGKEYEYDIDAKTGEILNKKIEMDD